MLLELKFSCFVKPKNKTRIKQQNYIHKCYFLFEFFNNKFMKICTFKIFSSLEKISIQNFSFKLSLQKSELKLPLTFIIMFYLRESPILLHFNCCFVTFIA